MSGLEFNRLVGEQMLTMDKLLSLQAELERQQELEKELATFQKEQILSRTQELELVQNKITIIKQELKAIQNTFTRQTEELIRVYQENSLRV